LAGDEPELARRRPPWRGGTVRCGPAISGGHGGRSKGTGASRLRGEGRARNRGWSEAVGRRAHGGGDVAVAEEEGSATGRAMEPYRRWGGSLRYVRRRGRDGGAGRASNCSEGTCRLRNVAVE
jgi:hypothetical protein